MCKSRLFFALLLILMSVLVRPTLAQDLVALNPAHVGIVNSEFGQGTCPTPPAGQEDWYGWHFVMPGNNNFTSLTVTFENAGTFTASPFPGGVPGNPVFVSHPDASHAYIWTPTDDKLLSGEATSDGANNFFNLSHVCTPGVNQHEALTVTKTAVTSFTREHFWDIAKRVETEFGFLHEGDPKIWLYTDGSGDETATWTVDVTYGEFVDSLFNVSGEITIENTGTLDAVITDVEDVLDGNPIDVDFGGVTFPYVLTVGQSLTFTYSEDGFVEGINVVTVTTERDEYEGEAEIVWGDPTTEINETVNISDFSTLYGIVALGTATAPNDETFTYDNAFAWADYGVDGCGDYVYDNIATIDETGQVAEATLKVSVQCFVYETAYAKGNIADCFMPTFANWGWTNPIMPGTYQMDLWAGAAQCDTSKGTLVGTVTVVYGANGVVAVTYNVGAPFILDETHVYAGTTKFPLDRRGRPTVAPGSYYNRSPFGGGRVYVIAHAVVGLPDPDFGP
jgi:hypothetical protein